ncbi:MAG: acyltransferase family protein [Polyangiaceae bacterium]|jgi:peptidoglycan/LPS O-acetylase OafA/YrhL/lysophospholipase L1-like esterase
MLRSAAVSFVVAFHLALFFGTRISLGGRWGALGHWGVLLFFVHTCLVLMQSLERLQRRIPSAHVLFTAFMVRRCFRLLPLSILTVLIVALLRLPVGHLHGGQFLSVPTRFPDVVANILLVQNLSHVESIEAPLWSLPLEMEMYLVLPLVFMFVRSRPTALRAIGLWAMACAVGLLCDRYRIGEMPAYGPCFLAGVVCYRLPRARTPRAYWLWPLTLTAVTAVYVGRQSLATGWLCCLAVGLAIPQLSEMPRGLLARACHYVARYSYGIYLWHFILIWFAFARLAAAPLASRWVVFVVLLIGVPVTLYHLVEAPMIRVGAATARRLNGLSFRRFWKCGALAAAALASVVGALRATAAHRPFALGLAPTPDGPSPVHLIGRFDLRDAAGPRFSWPGSALAVAFYGTGIDVRLTDWGSNFFTVVVDDGLPTTLPTLMGTHEYLVATDLPVGSHRVLLTKRTEALVGAVQYLGVMPRGGSLVNVEPSRPIRRIEYVGDSIACGYGVLGANAACSFSPETEDESIGFAAVAASSLKAEATVIAYSGKGVVRDYRGRTEDPMPVLFGRTIPDDPASVWDFQRAAPTAVVVEVGTNDYELGDPGPAFARAYASFVRDVRRRYPEAYILCTLSPMLSDSNPDGVRRRTAAATAIYDAVKHEQDAGDARLSYLAFDEQQESAGRGCDDHPSVRTHKLMAATLAATLRRVLGW